jgi:lysyl-tRNA synthetase class II
MVRDHIERALIELYFAIADYDDEIAIGMSLADGELISQLPKNQIRLAKAALEAALTQMQSGARLVSRGRRIAVA